MLSKVALIVKTTAHSEKIFLCIRPIHKVKQWERSLVQGCLSDANGSPGIRNPFNHWGNSLTTGPPAASVTEQNILDLNKRR